MGVALARRRRVDRRSTTIPVESRNVAGFFSSDVLMLLCAWQRNVVVRPLQHVVRLQAQLAHDMHIYNTSRDTIGPGVERIVAEEGYSRACM